MIVLARIKENKQIIGYIVKDNNSEQFISVDNTYKYKPTNIVILKNGTWKAKNGYHIKTVDKKDIQNRNTSLVGKPNLIYNYSFGKMSLVQRNILSRLDNNTSITVDKKRENLKITMKDLSALTAVTGIEYALFERNDKYIVFKGTDRGIHLDTKDVAVLLNGKYKWIGHTHPGDSFNCLIPSDGDYNTLKLFNQKQSMIYNSIGQYYIFGKEQ